MMKDMLKLFPLSQVIIPDFNLISDEYITHINGHNKGDVITITYSSYMQSKYPSQRYISALSLPSIIEDIIHKYMEISYNTCTVCGAPATQWTRGYLASFCNDCYDRVGYKLN